MRCEEIKERFIDLLYDEQGTPSASPELRGHLASCPACRQEFEELRATRAALATWKDEEPLRPVLIPRAGRPVSNRWKVTFGYLRFAAAAAVVVLAFLALANAEIRWNRDGFEFHTHMFGKPETAQDVYTKAEVRDLLKKVVDDTEGRMMETNYLMLQRMMDTIEEDRRMDLRLVRADSARNHNKN
jgi:hypothetical protein